MEKRSELLSSSKFFTVPETITPDQLRHYCNLWYPLQREFVFGTVMLAGKIGEAVLREERKDPCSAASESLRKVLALQMKAATDEVGIGRVPSPMHDQLFYQQISDSGISLKDVEKFSLTVLPEPLQHLRDSIRSAFQGLEHGLAMMVVVEIIAPKLFDTQYRIFANAGVDENALMHSKIHMVLERAHAEEAQDIGELIMSFLGKEKMDALMTQYSTLWKNYLDYVAGWVYEPVLS